MARKTLTLTIDLENAAFTDGFGEQEVAMLLKSAATRIHQGIFARDGDPLSTDTTPYRLIDTNGNHVGQVTITDEEESRVLR